MAIADDVMHLEQKLKELIVKYEQYFQGFEKREPLQLFEEVATLIRNYATARVSNTMYRYRYSMLIARFNTYREHWNRTLKLINEGRYSRDRFISDLHQQQKMSPPRLQPEVTPPVGEDDLDRLVAELQAARKTCNLPYHTITRQLVAAGIEEKKPLLVEKLGTANIAFRVVIENGIPKLKAGHRTH